MSSAGGEVAGGEGLGKMNLPPPVTPLPRLPAWMEEELERIEEDFWRPMPTGSSPPFGLSYWILKQPEPDVIVEASNDGSGKNA